MATSIERSAPSRGGFTVIEILFVLIIIGTLMALAVSGFEKAAADAQKRACRDKLQAIANLEEMYRIKSSAHVYASSLSQLKTLVSDPLPACPSGGVYSIQVDSIGRQEVKCDYHYGRADQHGTFTLGIESQ